MPATLISTVPIIVETLTKMLFIDELL